MWLHLPQALFEETKLFLLLRPVGGALGSRGSRLALALSPWAASQRQLVGHVPPTASAAGHKPREGLELWPWRWRSPVSISCFASAA